MSSNPPKYRDGYVDSSHPGDLIRTHAEMLAAEAEATAARRRVELEELRSDLKTPEQRVRAWEKVHGLTLPRDPNHRILRAVALETGLTLEQVQAVHSLR